MHAVKILRQAAVRIRQARSPRIRTPWAGGLRFFGHSPLLRTAVAEDGGNAPDYMHDELFPESEHRNWSEAEMDTVAKLPDIPLRDLARLVPGRSLQSVRDVRAHIRRDGVDVIKATIREEWRNRACRAWTASEVALLKQLSDTGCPRESMAQQLDRSWASVRRKLLEIRHESDMQVKSGSWTANEVEQLRSMLEQRLDMCTMSRRLGRSRASVKGKTVRLRRGANTKERNFYSAAEDAQLLALRADGVTWDEVHSRMPPRSKLSLRLRHRRLTSLPADPGKRVRGNWNVRDLAALHSMVEQKLPTDSIAARLNRGSASVNQKIYNERLTEQKVRREPWTEAELTKLFQLRNEKQRFDDIAISLGRSVSGCKDAHSRYRTTFQSNVE